MGAPGGVAMSSRSEEIELVREGIARGLALHGCEADWRDWLPEADVVVTVLGLNDPARIAPGVLTAIVESVSESTAEADR